MSLHPPARPAHDPHAWLGDLQALAERLRHATRDALVSAASNGDRSRLTRSAGQGAGDVTFGLDLPSEAELTAWLTEQAARGPLSLLTEDAGWRHAGPDGEGGVRALPGFDHGGPRIAVDPVDGTRNLMAELRSAWSVIGFAGPGPGPPRLSELTAGVLAEIPPLAARRGALLRAVRGAGCERAEFDVDAAAGREPASHRFTALRVDRDDRPDNGYFPFFRYMADLRPATAELEARFFARLAEHESADVRSCYDDQYISNAGQLALLAAGTYRFVVDARAGLAARRGRPTITSKPYDVAGALVCALEAGCAITDLDGHPLDAEIDAVTPVAFVGYANAPTRARLEPHWRAVWGP